jgi:hypothetical protein
MLSRYVENIAYIQKYLFSTNIINIEDKAKELDIYGFNKVIVALTNFGKIISFSSMDGSILWTSKY